MVQAIIPACNACIDCLKNIDNKVYILYNDDENDVKNKDPR
jgi:hypothetical protein